MREESGRGPSAYQLNALPLGQTGTPKTGFDDVGLDVLILGTATGFPKASSFKKNYRGKLPCPTNPLHTVVMQAPGTENKGKQCARTTKTTLTDCEAINPG